MKRTEQAKIADENFERYAKLLKELHKLFDDGEGDSEEADVVRDKMEDPWYAMSMVEQDRARALSVELKLEERSGEKSDG